MENMRNFLTAWEESKKADFRVLCTKVIDVIVPLLKFSSTRNKIIIDILMMFGCPSDLTEDVTSVLKRGVGSRNLSLKFASCDGILRLGLEKRLSDREVILNKLGLPYYTKSKQVDRTSVDSFLQSHRTFSS